MDNFILLSILIVLMIIVGLVVLLSKIQCQKAALTVSPEATQTGFYLQSFDSPLKSLSFEDAATLTPLLENMKLVADRNAVNVINTQLGLDVLNSGTNAIRYVQERKEYIVTFSKEGQAFLDADKLQLMKDKKGNLLPTLIKNGRTVEPARLVSNSKQLLSTVTKLSAVVVSSAHIISGADNAKKLKQISKDIKYLIQTRKNDQLGKLESIYKHAKELLAHERTPESTQAICNLSQDLHELRSTWRRDIDVKLSNIDNPENRSRLQKLFSLKKSIDNKIVSDISNCEEEFMLIEFSLLLHISLFDAIGKAEIFLTNSLPDELNQFRSTLKLLEKKSGYLSLRYPELTADAAIQNFNRFLSRSEVFVPFSGENH
jgi:uncharacterized Zn ribbon protein